MPGNGNFSVNRSKVKPQQFVTSPSETVWWKKRTRYYGVVQVDRGFPGGSAGKESACNVGDLGLIPGLGRSPGERKGYPLQYSNLENSMDCIVLGVAKSRIWLSDFEVSRISELRENASKLVELADTDFLSVERCWEWNRRTEVRGGALQRVLRALVFDEWSSMHAHWGMW